MNIRLLIIENLRQIQIDMIRRSYRSNSNHSSYRGQGRILNLLRETPVMSRTELGEKLNMSRAALAELLGKMEKNGLIERVQNTADKRRIDIKLTDKGREAAEHADLDKSTLPEMLDCLNGEELNSLNSYLEKIVANNRMISADSASEEPSEEEEKEILENVVESICKGCPGPQFCRHDYKKYGHDRPNPDYCKYADQFPF